MQDDVVCVVLLLIVDVYDVWVQMMIDDDKDLLDCDVVDFVYMVFYCDFVVGNVVFVLLLVDVLGFEIVLIKDQFIDIKDGWVDLEIWIMIKFFSGFYIMGYFLNLVDM